MALATAMAANYLLRRTGPMQRRLRDITEVKVEEWLSTDLDLHGCCTAGSGTSPTCCRSRTRKCRGCGGGWSAGFDRPEAAVIYAAAEVVLPVNFSAPSR